jgi:hypothetical protein
MRKLCAQILKLITASAILAALIYVGTDAFGRSWRGFVIRELAGRGLYLDFQRLILNPFGGILAREVQVFSDAGRSTVLMRMDHLNLDFNVGRLIEGSFVLEALELTHAQVVLPVDGNPMDQKSAQIEIEDLNARLFMQEGRLEVRQAEGKLSGIQLCITGELMLPTATALSPSPPEQNRTGMQPMDRLREHRQRIRAGLDWLSRFEFSRAPRLTLDIHGAMSQPEELTARLYFEAAQLSFATYRCEELRAEMEYQAGLVDLTRFYLKDRLGEVSASASWTMGSDDLHFHLTSSADLPGLAHAFFSNEKLREVVFYDSPHLALEGVWHVSGPLANHKRPVHVTGSLDCGRFGTRGEVFEGLRAMIGVAPEGVYIRDLLLRHKTGTLAAQTLVHETQGTRYDLVLRMDPSAFLPFAQMRQTREIIQRFEFTPESSIHFELTGSGPDPDPQKCLNRGKGDLRRFKYKGLYLEEMQADVEFQHPMQHYRNIRIRRQEGMAHADHVEVDDEQKWVRLEGIHSGIDPVGVVGVFAPQTAAIIARYRLPETTQVDVDGIIFYRTQGKNDFRVKFHHPTGSGRYSVLGEEYPISAPKGDLIFKSYDLKFDVSGQLFGGDVNARGSVNLSPDNDGYSVQVTADRFLQSIFSRRVPFEKVRANVSETAGLTRFQVQSKLMGGGFNLDGRLGISGDPRRYAGEMQLKNISMQRFAQVFLKGNDSQGDTTGHFKFTGQMNDWSALKGDGALTILNGDLYAIPVVGVLAPMLGTVLPKQIAGYNIAKEADCTFEIADGNLITRNFEALTNAFKILLNGRINFLIDQIDMNAQVRLRGLPGIVLLPFSELLEYRGTGSVADTRWEAKLLRGVGQAGRDDGSSRSTGPAASPPPAPVLPKLKKVLTPLFKSPAQR